MARNCQCAGSTCGCLVIAGAGIQITGRGTAADPYVVRNIASDLASSLAVTDTATVDMVRNGSGTSLDPFILSANVKMRLDQLIDVNDPQGTPAATESPVYVGTFGTDGHWEFRKPFVSYTTAGRPTPASAGVGGAIYDSTLGIPLWSNGTAWRKADGVAA